MKMEFYPKKEIQNIEYNFTARVFGREKLIKIRFEESRRTSIVVSIIYIHKYNNL